MMIGFWFVGPLIFGLWLMFKGIRNDELALIRVIWFFLGLGLFALGLFEGAASAVPFLKSVREATDSDDENREDRDPTRTGLPEQVFKNLPSKGE